MPESKELPPITIEKKTGHEEFHLNGQNLPFNISDFWRWSTSDLISNATRGVLAEFVVANALGIDLSQAVREEWAAYDLDFEGVKIEVKSSAYVQSWQQNGYSKIIFNISPSTWGNHNGDQQDGEQNPGADAYVFCVLTSKDKAHIDPLNLDEWRFYFLTTIQMQALFNGQKTVSLSTLERLGVRPLEFQDLRAQVEHFVAIKEPGL